MPRGWTPMGAEANANSDEGVSAPPDLKESFNIACFAPTGDAAIDREWFTDNVWPDEVPEYRAAVTAYVGQMQSLVDAAAGDCRRRARAAGASLPRSRRPPDVVVLHPLVSGTARRRRARAGSAADRLAHRLRDLHDPRPPARHRRAAGARQGRRVGGRAVGRWRVHHQHRRHDGALDRRPVGVQPAPGARAGRVRAGRGPDVARLLSRGQSDGGDQQRAATDRHRVSTSR